MKKRHINPYTIIMAAVVVAIVLFGIWYFTGTASGKRTVNDLKSDFGNGLERTITVYTADGKVIDEFHGNIDMEGNDGGYVLFEFEGKRYTYYNCFVKSVAELD